MRFWRRLWKSKVKERLGEEKKTVKDGEVVVPATENSFVPPPYEPKLLFPGRFKRQLLEKCKALFEKQMSEAQKKEMEGMMILTHECIAIFQRLVVPKKLGDPGCFTLPCALGPMYKKCRLSLVLVDRLVKYPVGILEDLPVMVGNYEILTEFVVLEMGEEAQDPLILGRPFLATA
ncbi:PREDICTED: uncharacterized protein LOC106337940 [Brassica oleracea var. oleracea]|uniref:uncharacterized protein LOC106337940 n=1 Tax=Brassica oleracea var. oleracea TaxID=109376 RepID=UPI0006A73CF1|nr:PREDICTED: uncharacterized protein LOC106337940 [Brassica oleracea var. oleracea]